MDFYSIENNDAIRFSWNNLPPSKMAALKLVVPPCVLYSPNKDLENIALLEYDPLQCKCHAMVNPYCQIDYRIKSWTCVFCGARNNFPSHYAQHISEENLPAELIDTYTTIEYLQTKIDPTPIIYLFLVDTCMDIEEFDALKNSIQQSLNLIPSNSLVGFITFGRFIFLHELGYQDGSKCFAFNGLKEYTSNQIQEMLGISTRNDPRAALNNPNLKRFILPLHECEFNLNSILDDLQPDPWPVPSDERPQRATGTAINIALSLLESCQIPGARIVSLIGGPCTVGPGQVVDIKLEQTIRSFFDIQKEKENTKYIKKASKYYQELSTRAIKSQMVIDMFGFSLDQFGLLEMKTMIEKTGGYIVVNEEFNTDIFKESFKKLFEVDANGNLRQSYAGKIEMYLSKDIKVQGAIGPCVSMKKNGPMVSEVEVGQGLTTLWYIGGMDRCTTLAFYLDIVNTENKKNTSCPFIQFQTSYKHSNGQYRLRVTTVNRRFSNDTNQDYAAGFDQEASCVSMARLCLDKTEKSESLEVLKWLDRSLIRLINKFSEFKKDDINSFRLSKEFSLFPQFMFHLRRSHFIQVFGSSPDESSFYRCTLLRENTTNSLVMIQPALLQYNFDNQYPIPVALDIESMKKDVILLLDSYFQVIVWHGDKIQSWKDQGYQDAPNFEHFKDLLQAPQEDVKIIMEDRFPSPNLIITFQGSGKERYIKSKVNPSTMNTSNSDSGNYITDDASLKVFMDHLVRLVVTQ